MVQSTDWSTEMQPMEMKASMNKDPPLVLTRKQWQ
jgi:hypothetical protein